MARLSDRQQVNPFLVGDVGGTYARLALASWIPGEHCLRMTGFRKYACADYAGLAAIVRDFTRLRDEAPMTGVLACAGCMIDGELVNRNLPWTVDIADLQQTLAGGLSVINDLEAAAFATRHLRKDARMWVVHEGAVPGQGTQVIVAPGTGLGAAVLVADPCLGVIGAAGWYLDNVLHDDTATPDITVACEPRLSVTTWSIRHPHDSFHHRPGIRTLEGIHV